MAAADNKKSKCATGVSSKEGFKPFVLKGFPPNMAEAHMKLSDAREMAAENLRQLSGACVVGSLKTPRVRRSE